MSAELLPCPFCGCPAETDMHRAFRTLSRGEIEDGVAIYCSGGCNADMMLCDSDVKPMTKDEMLAELTRCWNRRFVAPVQAL